ncbi:pentapeptide repeat-containing protein [candidate division KSB1 bacterium]
MADKNRCIYVFINGDRCPGEIFEDDEYCYWHSEKASKKGVDVKSELEKKIKNDELIEGYQLSNANLEGGKFIKANLKNVNLSRANLKNGSLFGVDLEGANLFKADFENANLKSANLAMADLLGTKLDRSKLERIDLGRGSIIINELEGDEAKHKGNIHRANEKYLEAEEIYRNIKNNFKNQGLTSEGGDFFYREMIVKRKMMPYWSFQRFWSKMIDFACGYGEKPYKIISFSLIFQFIHAIIFAMIGISYGDSIIRWSFSKSLIENLDVLSKCFYFSVVTYATLGYGEMLPTGIGRYFAINETFWGAFLISLFVITIYKKMMDR